MDYSAIENINSWHYKSMGAFMDGGTLVLTFETPSGEIKEVFLVQNMIANYYEEINNIPGRIYIDGQIVEKRSNIERSLIEYLENNVTKHLSEEDLELLNSSIGFIKSDGYLKFIPNKLEMSAKRKKT